MITAKQKIKVNVIIFVAFLLVAIFFGIIPLSSKLSKESKDLSVKKNKLSFLENQIKTLEDFQNSSVEYQQKINKLDSSFIYQEAPIDFIEFLEKEALNQRLRISLSSTRGSSEQKGSRLTIGFQAKLVGQFPNALVFLKKVEKSPWLIKVDQVNISRLQESTNPNNADSVQAGQVSLNVNFKTFSNYIVQN